MFRSMEICERRRERSETFDGTTMDHVYKSQVAEDIKTIVLNCLEGEGDYKLLAKLEREEKYIDGVTYESLVEHGVERDKSAKGFALVSRARHINSHLEMIDGILDEISSRVKDKIKTARQRIDHVASVCGLASVPSEVLSHVFFFVVHGHTFSNKPRSLISVRLSHVCRRFRYIVTTNPRFWTIISTKPFTPELGLVNACLERSKECPLEVHLNLYTTPSQVDPDNGPPSLYPKIIECDAVFSTLLPHIDRWRYVHFNFRDAKGFEGLSRSWLALQGTIFPMLDTIFAESPYCENSVICDNLTQNSSWNTPKLITMVLQNCTPRSLSSLRTVTTFAASYSTLNSFVDMFKTLNEMPFLSDLRVDVSELWRTMDSDNLSALKTVTIGTAKRFEFDFRSYHAADGSEHFRMIRDILSKLSLPNATNLILQCIDTDHYSRSSLSLDRILTEVVDRSPRVIECDIVVKGGDPTIIPSHLPTNLETLRIVCDSQLDFSQELADKIEAIPSKIRRISLGINSNPSLETRGAIEWMGWLKERMRKNGGWDTFEDLAILKGVENEEYYPSQTKFEFERVIPREEIDEWCKSMAVFPKIASEYSSSDSESSYGRRSYSSWD